MIAALFVAKGGCYFGLPDVDPWPEERDARLYAGPWPVVAHPPCARWGFFWWGGPTARERRKMGDDDGCFAAALMAVHRWGGVLEHPANSRAWVAFGLPRPPRRGWIRALDGGWCTHVEQGQYGHRARKATWLYARGQATLPALRWGPGPDPLVWCSNLELDARKRVLRTGVVQLMSKRERAATPTPFRDLLLSIAQSVKQPALAVAPA